MNANVQRLQIDTLAGVAASSALNPLFVGLQATKMSALPEGALTINCLRRFYPWEKIADWTHSLPTNPTDHWMDALGRDQFYHRWRGHHLFTDGYQALRSSKYSAWDFSKHLSLDFITKHGIPLLPASGVELLSTTLGISVNKLMPWILMNPFDLVVGVLAVGGSAHDLVLAFTGQLPWGVKTAVFTFGLGGVEMGTGLAGHQPLLVLAGSGEISAGAVSMWEYYTQPMILGIPVAQLLTGLGCGLTSGLVCSALSMGISWNNTTADEKAINCLRTTIVATIIGGLSAITPCLSIPVSLAWSFGSMAARLANDQKQRLQRHPLSSPRAFSRSVEKMLMADGPEATARWLQRASRAENIQSYQNFVTQRRSEFNLTGYQSHVDQEKAAYIEFQEQRAKIAASYKRVQTN